MFFIVENHWEPYFDGQPLYIKGDYYKPLFLCNKFPFGISLDLLRADDNYPVV
jgi:hypothetical protein